MAHTRSVLLVVWRGWVFRSIGCLGEAFSWTVNGPVFPQNFVCKSMPQKIVLMQELLQDHFAVKIGSARVSTHAQKLDLQLKALKKAECQKVFREKVSGVNRQRPEFQRMLDQLRPGDTIAEAYTPLLSESKAVRDIARAFKVHEATIYR